MFGLGLNPSECWATPSTLSVFIYMTHFCLLFCHGVRGKTRRNANKNKQVKSCPSLYVAYDCGMGRSHLKKPLPNGRAGKLVKETPWTERTRNVVCVKLALHILSCVTQSFLAFTNVWILLPWEIWDFLPLDCPFAHGSASCALNEKVKRWKL